jgi:predicted transposase YbfD/YdcC
MAEEARLTRRVIGVLATRLPEAQLGQVADPRRESGRRWPLATLLRTALVGCVAGCKSLAQTEALTKEMSKALRRTLDIPRRVPDTTMRDALVQVEPAEVRKCLHAVAKAAHRRKALQPVGLPFGVVAMDGKGTAATAWDNLYAQRQPHSADGGASGIVRTMTCCLISSSVKVCLDAIPVPAVTNEMGQFQASLRSLMATYGRSDLFRLITYDAGGCSAENAQAIRDELLHYLFGLKGSQPTLLAEARRLLENIPVAKADAMSEDVNGPWVITRRVFLSSEMAGYEWAHLQTALRVHSEKRDLAGKLLESEDRYYISSLPRQELTDEQWLLLVRRHWGVENNCHNTWDTVFQEDDHPWIEADPKGMVVVMLLRRLAYNILALFRGVTQRSEERRQTPWRDMVRSFYNAIIAATTEDVAGLRSRQGAAASLA